MRLAGNTRKPRIGSRRKPPSVAIPSGVCRISAADFIASLAAVAQSEQPTTKRARPEEELQIACNEWLEVRALGNPMPLDFMFHPANGGFRTAAEAGRLKAMGVKPGVPDWICPIPWRGWSGLAIELKAPDAPGPRKKQKAWLDGLQSAGYLTGTARSLDQFIRLVEQYVQGRGLHPA